MKPLLWYAVRRGAGALAAIAGVSLLVFALRHAVPGDPVDAMLGEQASAADRELLRRCLDLDKSIGGQLASFAADVFSGTLGTSCRDGRTPVLQLIAEVLPRTMELAVAALALALLAAVPMGVLAALRPGTWLDATVMTGSLLGIAIPTMWLGPMLLLLFYVQLGWLPGPADPPTAAGALLLPALTLASHLAAMLARMTRASLLEILSEDFIRTARAKGLSYRQAVVRHGLPNALIPVITVAGIQLGALLAGAIVTEKIFARPGVGTLLLDALSVRDWKTVQGVVLVVAICYVLVNLLVDLLYATLDPRMRTS